MSDDTIKLQFDPGTFYITPGAKDALDKNGVDGSQEIARHLRCDWGELCDDDRTLNNEALKHGARLMSKYVLPDDTVLWIITEQADEHGRRAATTLLLPEEY